MNLEELITNVHDVLIKPTLFENDTAYAFVSQVQGRDPGLDKQLPKCQRCYTSSRSVTVPRFRVIPTNVKTECTVTQSCVAVMSQATGALNPFGAERRRGGREKKDPLKSLTHHKT